MIEDYYQEPHSYVVKTRKGFDARCYRLAVNPNHIGMLVTESSHRTLAAAIKAALKHQKLFGGTIAFPQP